MTHIISNFKQMNFKIFISTAVLFIVPLLISAFPEQSNAQDMETLIGNEIRHGGFGGPVVRFGNVDGDFAVWVGGRGGWIINMENHHSISIGGGGYGLTTEHRMPVQKEDTYTELAAVGYGGFEIEYTNRTYRLVHPTVTTLIGAGGISIRDDKLDHVDHDPDPFFVLEPGINAELNVTGFFRISTGVSYRLTSGIDRGGFDDDAFSGVNAVITLKFGSF